MKIVPITPQAFVLTTPARQYFAAQKKKGGRRLRGRADDGRNLQGTSGQMEGLCGNVQEVQTGAEAAPYAQQGAGVESRPQVFADTVAFAQPT